jgi:hypothetical protein
VLTTLAGEPINPTPRGSRRPRPYKPRSDNGASRAPKGPAPKAPHAEEIDVEALAAGSKPAASMSAAEKAALRSFLRTGRVPAPIGKRRAYTGDFCRLDARLCEILRQAHAPDAEQLMSTVRAMRIELFEATELLRVYQAREKKATEERELRLAFEAGIAVEEIANKLGRKKSWVDHQFKRLRDEAAEREREALAAAEEAEVVEPREIDQSTLDLLSRYGEEREAEGRDVEERKQ